MTKQVFSNSYGSLAILGPKGYSTHSVVGTPADFYCWVDARPPKESKRVKGNTSLYTEFKRLHDSRQREGFIKLVEQYAK